MQPKPWITAALISAFLITLPAFGQGNETSAEHNGGSGIEAEVLDEARRGNPRAQYMLGNLHRMGLAEHANNADAARWFELSAKNGNMFAQFELGKMYSEGVGVPHDEAMARRWLTKSAEQGFAGAEYALALKYDRGTGVEQNDATAARWYRRAADNGYPLAQNRIGELLAAGKGVRKDRVEAYMWFELAYLFRNIDPDGAGNAAENAAALRAQLTPAEIDAAVRRGQDWLDAFERRHKAGHRP